MRYLAETLLFIAGAVLFGLAIGLLADVVPFSITGSDWVLAVIVVVLLLMSVESFRRSRRRRRLRRQPLISR